jgi:LuxR family maltose regulon positive regulatory protein
LEQLVDTLHSAQVDGRVGTVIEAKCLRALALQESGHPEEALAALGEALELGESAGYARVFVDAGPPMMELLRRAGSRGIRPGYVGHLIAAFGATHPAVALDDMGRPIPIQPLVEPLTARELEVLQLLAEGLPNREIARRLFVSLSTTKTHTRNVYGKLGVRSRGEAVDRARTLGILPDH